MRNNIVRKIVLAAAALAIMASPALAWDNVVTHPGITKKAIQYLVSTNPTAYGYLNNYINFNIAVNPQLTFMDEGSVKEDYGVSADWDTAVWGSSQDSLVPSLSWKSHGYDPKTGVSWYDMPEFQSAYVYSGTVYNNILSASNRYFQIGRFVHLIEDMGSPAHANADFHGTGDDMEEFCANWYSTVSYAPAAVRKPSTHGLKAVKGLPNPALTTNNSGNFIRNMAWNTYYMTTFYGGTLVEVEGNAQPDSELKRMFPYGTGGGLRYDDGGWFTNDAYVIDAVGWNWIGYGIGNNPDWWGAPNDAKYFYLENVDGGVDTYAPSTAGNGVAPAVFKVSKFRRVLPTDNLSTVLAPNTQIFARIFAENLFKLAAEWVAGFVAWIG
ncbi:MAG: hypothetical protein HZB23_02100 [Deltaproteobacteria bacterium]|nr:hypothetical protein [Deltaproteobacteria bacterium]